MVELQNLLRGRREAAETPEKTAIMTLDFLQKSETGNREQGTGNSEQELTQTRAKKYFSRGLLKPVSGSRER